MSNGQANYGHRCYQQRGCDRNDCGEGLVRRCKGGGPETYTEAEHQQTIATLKAELIEKVKALNLPCGEINDYVFTSDMRIAYGMAKEDFIKALSK